MFRFLILLLCVIFMACSSDEESAALKEWLGDQKIAAYYGRDTVTVTITVDSAKVFSDESAYMVSSYAALGNINGIENLLYFGVEVPPGSSLARTWVLRTDSLFYADFAVNPELQEHGATIYWLTESEFKPDGDWLKSIDELEFPDFADHISLKQEKETFSFDLPEKLLEQGTASSDTLRLLAGIKLHTSSAVLRIAPPSILDIPHLLRVAQKQNVLEDCEQCLRSGIRDSLFASFNLNADDKERIAGKTVVFAQLFLPKENVATGGESKLPLPIYVSGEDYRVDSDYVEEYGHPNLIFWPKGDGLILQVANALRNYSETIDLVLRLGFPMLDPHSLQFYNSSLEKVFLERPVYARYDFSSALGKGKTAELKLWLADYGDKK